MMTIQQMTDHLVARLREVQRRLGADVTASAELPFAEAVDSMGLVEFVGVIASDCGVTPDVIEQAAGRRFSTIDHLARALVESGITPGNQITSAFVGREGQGRERSQSTAFLSSWETIQPSVIQPTVELDRCLSRPEGWLEQHAGIRSRWCWGEKEDPLARTAAVAQRCLPGSNSLAALLVTGEAPSQLVGRAVALHGRLGLPANLPALEIGGACLGWLHGLWLGQRLLRPDANVLLVAEESPSRWLTVQPGTEGESAALFGDGAAVALLSSQPPGFPLRDILLGCASSDLVTVRMSNSGPVIHMDGPALALRAVHHLADGVWRVCERNGITPHDLDAVYVHAGNGRLARLVAQRLEMDIERVISTSESTGNLGSVSLPAAMSQRPSRGPFVLSAVGAGLGWGAALFDAAFPG